MSFQLNGTTLVKYTGTEEHFTVPDGVKKIGESAFRENGTLKSVTLPESVTEIGGAAFYSCYSLSSINLPEGLKKVGSYAFFKCYALETMLPSTLYHIDEKAFYECYKLPDVILSENVKFIGKEAFAAPYTSRIIRIVLPKPLTAEVRGYFKYQAYELDRLCYGFFAYPELYPEEAVADYIKYAVKDKATFQKALIPAVKEGCKLSLPPREALAVWARIAEAMGDGALAAVLREGADTKEALLARLDVSAFKTEDGILTSYVGNSADVTVPEGIREIADGAFRRNGAILSVTLPKSLTKIGSAAFEGCKNLETVTFSEGLVTVGEGAFKDCEKLSSLAFPESVRTVGAHAAEGCAALKSILLPDGVETVSKRLCAGCKSLSSVRLPLGLVKIEERAFFECYSLYSISFPDSLREIAPLAFQHSSIRSITLPKGMSALASSAFSNCIGLRAVTLPEGLTCIGDSAFYGCEGLRELELPASLCSVGEEAFSYYDECDTPDYDCYSEKRPIPLDKIVFPKKLSEIRDTPALFGLYYPKALYEGFLAHPERYPADVAKEYREYGKKHKS